MNWDVLLYWMTHTHEGAWEGFKRAISRMAGDEGDCNELTVGARFYLSDLGFVDFFVEGSRRWRVLPPTLAGFETAGTAVLIGGRTPRIEASLLAAAEQLDCEVAIERGERVPTTFRVTGESAMLLQVADRAGLRYSARHASALAAQLVPLFKTFEQAAEETPPTNWRVRSFDFATMSMVDGLHRHSACEFTPRRGVARWYVHSRRGRLRSLPKREAIYAAAMLQGVRLLSFEPDGGTLFSPASIPMPEAFTRVACLCSGRRPSFVDGKLAYSDIPVSIASMLSLAVGQGPGVAATHR